MAAERPRRPLVVVVVDRPPARIVRRRSAHASRNDNTADWKGGGGVVR